MKQHYLRFLFTLISPAIFTAAHAQLPTSPKDGKGYRETPVKINDLVNPDGTAAGTEVIIKMPVIYD